MKDLVIALLVVGICPGIASCSALGSYSTPTEAEISAARRSAENLSRQDAVRELRGVFAGIRHVGRLIFDECPIQAFGEWAFEVSCTSYKQDPSYRDFRLTYEGSYSMTVPYCAPTLKATQQVPTLAHYFFVNGFSFSGDAARALRAYGLLSRLCAEDAQRETKQEQRSP